MPVCLVIVRARNKAKKAKIVSIVVAPFFSREKGGLRPPSSNWEDITGDTAQHIDSVAQFPIRFDSIRFD